MLFAFEDIASIAAVGVGPLLMLKRAGVERPGIRLMLGVVLMCSSLMMLVGGKERDGWDLSPVGFLVRPWRLHLGGVKELVPCGLSPPACPRARSQPMIRICPSHQAHPSNSVIGPSA